MNRMIPIFAIALGVAAVLLFLLPSPLAAQSRATDRQDVDTLIERIKAARARDERLTGEGETRGPDLTTPKEAKPKVKPEAKKETEKDHADRVMGDIEKSAKNPREYMKDMGTPRSPSSADLVKPYAADGTVEGLLDRIRAGRSEQAEKEKAQREKAGGEGVKRETSPVEERNPATSDAAAYRRYVVPMRGMAGTVGGEALMAPRQAPTGVAEIRSTAKGATELPDPSKETSLYDTQIQKDLGVRAALPQYADRSLLGIYQADQFNRWLSLDRDVRIDPGRMDLTQVYQTYKQFQNTPDTGSVIGRRDVYVPNSTNFINPAYRGSIYDVPYSTDPFRRNYSTSTTSSQYSSSGYYNLNVGESYSDYYQREYGVGRNFVPSVSSSRAYEVNTVKQWTQDLRNNYGIDVRPGQLGYSNLYRLRTSRPR